MPRGKRVEITIRIPPMARQDFDKFLEKLSKALYGDTVVGSIKGDSIKLYVYGSKLALHRTVRLVRQLLREYSAPETPRGTAYSIRFLSKHARTALPPDVMVEVLRAMGYNASWSADRLVTDAPRDVVLEAASLVAEAIRKLATVYATRTVKKILIVALALYPELHPSIIQRALIDVGAADYDDEGKLVPRKNWREGLKEVLARLEGSGGD